MRLSLVAVGLCNKVAGVLRGADIRHEKLQDQTELNDIEEEPDSTKDDSAQERQDSADKAVSKSHEREEDQSCPGASCQNDEQNVDEGGELQGDKVAEGEVKQRLEEARTLGGTTVLCGLLRVLILRGGSKGRVLLAESLLLLCPEALLALGAEALVLLLVATKTGRGVGVRSLGAEAITRLAGVKLALLPREFALLDHLARHAGRTVPREELLRAVFGLRFDPGTNVLAVHASRLRRALDHGFDVAMLVTDRGRGYRLVAAPDGVD